MQTRLFTAAALTGLLLTGCGSRRPAALPPAPSDSDGGGISGNGTENGGTQGGEDAAQARTERLRADFIAAITTDHIFFALDSYTLNDESRATLDSQATWLSAHPNVNVTIEGHCDERGTREYNLALGERRANAARLYLESRGVASARMQVISWGKERPEVQGADETAYARNRRAVTVLPVQ